MYSDSDLLPISGLQHLAFCPRQCALIHLERLWDENFLTASGRVMHDRVHNAPSESRGDVRTVRGLMLRSLRLGMTGIADVVEFHRVNNDQHNQGEMDQNDELKNIETQDYPIAVKLPKKHGLWRPYPVEYKRGNPKKDHCDAVQLCAQAMCLEEMLHCSIQEAALYYGQPRRREIIPLDDSLRQETERLAREFHNLIDSGNTPPPVISSKCKACSLHDDCFPDIKPSTVMNYLQKNWKEAESLS